MIEINPRFSHLTSSENQKFHIYVSDNKHIDHNHGFFQKSKCFPKKKKPYHITAITKYLYI